MPRVLIVDDDATIRDLLRRILESSDEGLEVVAEAIDGIEALRAWRASHPDVIVLDQQMPGLCGLDVARAILHEQPSQAIVMFSGLASTPELEGAGELGVRAVLDKTDIAALPEAIHRYATAVSS